MSPNSSFLEPGRHYDVNLSPSTDQPTLTQHGASKTPTAVTADGDAPRNFDSNLESETSVTKRQTGPRSILPPEAEDSPPSDWSEIFNMAKVQVAEAISKVKAQRNANKTKTTNLLGKSARKTPGEEEVGNPMNLDEALSRATDLQSFKDQVNLLLEPYYMKQEEKERSWLHKSMNRLLRCASRVNEFQGGISSAVQADPTSGACLGWGLLLIVIQFSCLYVKSAEMFAQVLETLSDTHETLPSLERDASIYSQRKRLQEILVDIFREYIKLCVAAIEYSANFGHIFHKSRTSTQPGKEMNNITERIKTHRERFDREVKQIDRRVVIHGTETILSTMDEYANASRQRDEITKAELKSLATKMDQPPKKEAKLPVKSLYMPRNNEFTGREDVLGQLQLRLITENKSTDQPATCCLLGVGGMGKSEAALEFAYRYLDHWDAGIFWVAADTSQETELLRTFCDIGIALEIVNSDIFDDRNVFIVKQWLQDTDKKWLIVFDGFAPSGEDSEWQRKLDRVWPSKTKAAGCAIIVTSQFRTIRPKYARNFMVIEPFEPLQGLRLLLDDADIENLSEFDKNTALEILQELGGSPLFVKLAKQYRQTAQLSMIQCLHEIRGKISPPLANLSADEVSGDWRYNKAGHKVLDLILRQLERRDPGAIELLDMLALMHNEDIKESIISPKSSIQSNIGAHYHENRHRFIAAGLVKLNVKDGRSLQIHRSVQVALLAELSSDVKRREAAFERLSLHLRAVYPVPSPLQIANADTSAALSVVLPHMLSLLKYFEQAGHKGSVPLARLISDVGGMDCYDRGLIQECYRLTTAVVEMLKPLAGCEDGVLLSDALTIQGLCTDFMALSMREEGLRVRKQCLDIRRRVYEQKLIDNSLVNNQKRLYNSYTDLSCSLQQINDFEGVRVQLEKCYPQYKKWGGEEEEPYEYSKYYNQMAYVLLYENQVDKAVVFADRGYELAELSSPKTNYPWLYKFDYVNILWQHGERKQEAFQALKDIIKEHSQQIPASYSEILSLGMEQNLGIMAYYLGDFKLAESQLRGLASRTVQCAAWPEENVVRGDYYLSQVLKAKNSQSQEALELERTAIAELTRLLANDTWGIAEAHAGDYPMLFDYLMHWEFRLISPRRAQIWWQWPWWCSIL